jgi:2-polyprenyl-3-methyl-5-hydroxy-6-metoxy-1,4-benzoquinol methylase
MLNRMDVCIACGGSGLTVAFEKNGCEILRCSSCGLGRTRVPDSFDPTQLYTEEYFQGGAVDGYGDYVGSEATLRSEFRRTVGEILRLDVRRGALLEFGCAYGFLLQEAKPFFERVHGIEIADDAVRFCRARGLDVASGVVEPSAMKGPYDVVVGLDVIEHVPRPDETVEILASAMRPGAALIMTTGDWGTPVAKLTGRHWRLMTPPQHLSFFTAAAMRAMLERAGFRVASLSHPAKRVPLSLIAYQLQRFTGKPRNFPILNKLWLPANLWDAMRVVAIKS